MSKKWTNNVMFPTNSDYICRVTEATFGESKSSGNPMITVKTEIYSPETVEVTGEQYNIAGTQPQPMYFPVNVSEGGELNEEKTANSLNRVKDFLTKLNIDIADFNPENPAIDKLKGKMFHCVVSGESDERRASPTTEELVEAKSKNIHPSQAGKVMKNPMNGQPLVSWKPIIKEVFGEAQAAANKPY